MSVSDQSQTPVESVIPVPRDPMEAQKLAQLKRVRGIATAMLAISFVVFLTARYFQGVFPALAYVAAFAEAATIGGLADWYAVVALFKRPLGLPIPHTAIIPENRHRIADNLGHFIEVNFLAKEPVRRKLEEVDFAALVADWLSDRRRSQGLADFVTKLVPQTLDAVENSGLRRFIAQRAIDQVEKVEIAPLTAEFLKTLTKDGKHQQLLDQILGVLWKFLNDSDAHEAIRDKIREELPSLFNLFRADAYLLTKVLKSAGSLLEDVRDDPDHPLRDEFDRFFKKFIRDLRRSKRYAKRAEELKHSILERPELRTLGHEVWDSFKEFVEKDVSGDNSMIRERLADLFVEVGKQLKNEGEIRKDMNSGFVIALSSFVEAQKSGVSIFIADQVKGWDMAMLVRLIETNIGKDLQYIRFNGMIIGGIAGLLLYTIGQLAGGH